MNRLKEQRKRKGITQKDLAFITGYTQSYVSMIEKGVKRPTYNAAYKFSIALGTTIEELFLANEGDIIKQKARLLSIANERKGGINC